MYLPSGLLVTMLNLERDTKKRARKRREESGPKWHAQQGVQRKFHQMNVTTLPSVPRPPSADGAVSNKSHRVGPICRILYLEKGEFLCEIH